LLFHCNSSYTNVLQCYVVGTLPVLLLYKACCGIKWDDIGNMFEKVMKKIKLYAL